MISDSDMIADRVGRAHIEDLQPQVPAWCLMYSPRRRCLVGFFMGHCHEPVIVEADDPDELRVLMDTAEIVTAPLQPPAAVANPFTAPVWPSGPGGRSGA